MGNQFDEGERGLGFRRRKPDPSLRRKANPLIRQIDSLLGKLMNVGAGNQVHVAVGGGNQDAASHEYREQVFDDEDNMQEYGIYDTNDSQKTFDSGPKYGPSFDEFV